MNYIKRILPAVWLLISLSASAQEIEEGKYYLINNRGNQTGLFTFYSMFIANEQNLLHEAGCQYFSANRFLASLNFGSNPTLWKGRFSSMNAEMSWFVRHGEKSKSREVSPGYFAGMAYFSSRVEYVINDNYWALHGSLGWKSFMQGDTFTVSIDPGRYRFTQISATEVAAGISFIHTRYLQIVTRRNGRLIRLHKGMVFRVVADVLAYPVVRMAYDSKSPDSPELTSDAEAFRSRIGWRVFAEGRFAGLKKKHWGIICQAGVVQPVFYQDAALKIMPVLSFGLFYSTP